jgi:hypothetical protein
MVGSPEVFPTYGLKLATPSGQSINVTCLIDEMDNKPVEPFQSLFMLLLLLLAMGWAVTRQELKWKSAIFAVWLTYSLLHCLLYLWKKASLHLSYLGHICFVLYAGY